MVKRRKMPHGGEVQIWEKGESGNPKGRKKLTLTSIIDKLNAEGIETPSKSEIEHAYISLTVMTEEQLKNIAKDNTKPALLRICATKIASNEGFDIIERMIDRALGGKLGQTQAPASIDMTDDDTNLINQIKGIE